mgnify:CR=1 FL=1
MSDKVIEGTAVERPDAKTVSCLIFSEWFWGTCSDAQAVTVLDAMIGAMIWGGLFEASAHIIPTEDSE